MWNSMLSALFGCRHENTTFPFTPKSTSGSERPATYVTCLDCGQELQYDWANMHIGAPVPEHTLAPRPR